MNKFFALLSAAVACSAVAQSPLVIPFANAAVDGNSSTSYPFDVANGRFLYIYDATHFLNNGVTSPIIISQIRWRANAATATWAGSASTLQLDLSTAPVDYTAISTTWDNNHGGDRATVFNGAYNIAAGSSTAGVPGPFSATVTLATPFLYDPNLGDLTIDTTFLGNTAAGTPTMDAVTTAGVANAKRVYSVTNPPAATATLWSGDIANVLEFTFTPATGLHPAFSASSTSGPLGHTVNFTDQTYTSDPGGVTSYAWDVDGDTVTDYTTQNCSHSYTTEGLKTVSLTVTSALFGTQTYTRTNYITIDAVDASFTSTVVTGTVVSFTDTSTGNPTTWAWDFENDGIVDSTSQNPAFVYPAAGQYTVKLTVTDAFSTDQTTSSIGIGIIPVPGFGSTFNGNYRGFWFQSPTRFSIVSANVPNELSEAMQNVAIFRLASAPPTFSTTATGGLEFFASNQPTTSPIPCAVSFDVGEFVGVLGACGTTTGRNSYATPTGPFASSVLGQPTTLTRFGTQYNLNTQGPTFAYPYWQEPTGAISRVILGVTAAAGIPYGAASASGAGPNAPRMRCTALPFIGQTATLSVEQNDTGVLSFMVGGFGRTSLPTPYGTILADNIVLTEVMNGAAIVGPGTYTYNFNTPNDPGLVGLNINWQNANFVIATSQVSMSNGVEFWLAN